MSTKTITLDVRDDIRAGREPFSKIMTATAALQANDQLLLIAPFEPKPLFDVLRKQGFGHSAKVLDSGDWEVLFARHSAASGVSPQVTTAAEGSHSGVVSRDSKVVDVDARGLEPPQPLVTILEAIATLPGDAELRVRTDRRPMHLYPQLEQRGFVGETEEQTDGSYLTHIRRT